MSSLDVSRRSSQIHDALDAMLAAVCRFNGLSDRDRPLLESQWKTNFFKTVEPSNDKTLWESKTTFEKVYDKLVIVRDSTTEQHAFLKRDNGHLVVQGPYEVKNFLAGLLPTTSFRSLAHSRARIGLRQALISNVLAYTNGRSSEGGYRFRNFS
ncbi:uncharacterized protein JCM6883_003160 [Sporobolomyces salmoneus]|uniref:uncharacterized protein n=1 Tax=Sporobolomyces salmoneus TaxID=183962 RepID=UPI00316DA536